MVAERFKTPTPKVSGVLRPSLSNFIRMVYIANIVHHCKTEVALVMANPPLPVEVIAPWRRAGRSLEGNLRSHPHRIAPQDTPEAFSAKGHITFIYKGYLFQGQLDGWSPNALTIYEKKSGNGSYKALNVRIQTFCYAYGICHLEGLNEINIALCGGNLQDVEDQMIYHHDQDRAEVEGYLDTCVEWAAGLKGTMHKNCRDPQDRYRKFCELLDYRTREPYYECPYYG